MNETEKAAHDPDKAELVRRIEDTEHRLHLLLLDAEVAGRRQPFTEKPQD